MSMCTVTSESCRKQTLKSLRLAQLLVYKGAIGLGDFAANRQVAERWREPEFDFIVVFTARFSY